MQNRIGERRKGYYMGVWWGLRICWCICFHMETPTVAVSSFSSILFCQTKHGRKEKSKGPCHCWFYWWIMYKMFV